VTAVYPSLTRRPLSDGWQVRAARGPAEVPGSAVPATVPGVVHLDLLAAGLIPDPYLDDNESRLAWIGLVDWSYETTFDVSAAALAASERHEIVFEGVDTVATISLNGRGLAEVANQHRLWRLDVTGILTEGANTLAVDFRSPIRYANEQSVVLGARERPYPLPYEAIRKSACSFGWDWGISTATSGIWRPVRLESWSAARLDRVLVRAEPDGSGGLIHVDADVVRAGAGALSLAVSAAGVERVVEIADGDTSASLTVELEHAERWWPAGHGEQPLYDVEIELRSGQDPLGSASRKVGFRSLRWDTEPDEAGAPFQLIVNDRPIFVKGVNWIPDDAFSTRVDRARYRRRLEQAKAANVNLIRVWGGGIYEADDFYELADELGLLTWQDFLFACAAYPEEEPLRGEIEAEARDNVARIAHHASLALLTGNNENLWGFEDWGWKDRLDGKTWGAHYYYELLPATIAEIAPHVPYAPGSPFSPGMGWDGEAQTGPHPNAETHGTMHLWEQWNRLDWSTYRDHRPRFVAEFGWQGPPAWSTLTRSISDAPLTPESPGMIVHQKAIDGNAKLTGGLVPHYRKPEDIETWHWAMQLNQADAVLCALEWFRSHAPYTAGAVVWQLNDCWPVTSWAAIDGDGREKPLLFALKKAFAPRAVSIQPSGDGLVVALTNETAEAWSGNVVLQRVGFDGAVSASVSVPASIDAWSTVRVDVPAELAAPDAAVVLTAEALEQRGVWWFTEPRDSALQDPSLSATVTRTGNDAFDVAITAGALARDITLLVDKIAPEATVDRGLVTLLPGETGIFRVSGIRELDAEQILRAEVARTANQLVVGR